MRCRELFISLRRLCICCKQVGHKTMRMNLWESLFGKRGTDVIERQVIVSKWLNFLTFIVAVSAIITFLYVRSGIVHSDHGLMETNRAWIAVNWIRGDFKDGNFLLHIRVMNPGKVPATDLNLPTPKVTFVDLTQGDENINWPEGDFCDHTEAVDLGRVIYPDVSQAREHLLVIPATSFAADDWQDVVNRTKGMMVVGCVAYITFKELHRTQYCILERRLPDGLTQGTDCMKGSYAK